jgi:dTDP-4-dehydrorhamnose reductase
VSQVVVVGSTGFLGSRLLRQLRKHTRPVGVGRRREASLTDVVADLRNDADLDHVRTVCHDTLVYYCAAVGGREAAMAAPNDAYRINSEVPTELAAVARTLVYLSTDYVFSRPGEHTPQTALSPDSVYATSKAAGEHGVLHASARSLVVRTSGLYDECGTRNRCFQRESAFTAPDNWVTSPTYVPDLIRAMVKMVDRGERGICHVVGPMSLSQYEFYQMASARWSLDVTPTLAGQSREGVALAADRRAPVRHPAEVFQRRWQQSPAVWVFDCVGALLAQRTWKHPDPAFWAEQEQRPDAWPRTHRPEDVAELYGPNPALWSRICRAPGTALLANNGPQASFEHWVGKYGLDKLFDGAINSERDRAAKPGPAFAAVVNAAAGGRKVTLFDDRPEIIQGIRPYGWSGVLTEREDTWPIASYRCEMSELP